MEGHEKKPVRPRCIPQIVSPKWLTSTEKVGFLDLPGEIRNKIYRLVLVQHPGLWACEHLIPSLALPALTLVNKQIFAEALPIFYAENTFYLLLWAWGEGPSGQDPTDFHRFTRMVEYFGRPTTSTKDQNPMRYIKNIVVQIRNSTSESPGIECDLEDRPWGRFIYNHLSIRGGQQSITYKTDPVTAGETFDPGRYRWTVGDVSVPKILNIAFFTEAYHLLGMSFAPRTQPIAMTIGRLWTELFYSPLRLMKDLRGTRPFGSRAVS